MLELPRLVILVAAALSARGAAQPVSSPTPRPRTNLVVVLVDDLGWMDLSCQGSQFYATPHIDRLAREGIRFTSAYAACAVCSPTRAAVLTGRSPARTGVTDWIRPRFQRGRTPEKNPVAYVGGPKRRLLCPPNPFWMELEERTLAELLRPSGFATCHIGKWHLGDEAWFPEHQGFDENFGGCDFGQPPSYFDPYSNKRLPEGIPTLPPRRKGEYLTDREGDEAVAFIQRNKSKRFFLFYAPYAVHTPIQAKADLTETYAKRRKPGAKQANPKYAAMVHSVDETVGKIYEALRAQGILDRTVILFTSDNGGLRGPTDNTPLRSGKGYPYEGGIRVPLILRWPGVVRGGSESDVPVTSVDCLPTALDILNVTGPAADDLDGESLVPHLRTNGKGAMPPRSLFWHFPHYRYGQVTPYSIVRRGEWKLIKRYEGPTYELFNLEEDLAEAVDLAAKQPDLVRKLDAELVAHLKNVGAKLPKVNPAFVGKRP